MLLTCVVIGHTFIWLGNCLLVVLLALILVICCDIIWVIVLISSVRLFGCYGVGFVILFVWIADGWFVCYRLVVWYCCDMLWLLL